MELKTHYAKLDWFGGGVDEGGEPYEVEHYLPLCGVWTIDEPEWAYTVDTTTCKRCLKMLEPPTDAAEGDER